MDDVWSEDNDVPSEIAMLNRRHTKQGYIDGKSQWLEQGLQVSFDQGYPIGAKLAVEVGNLIGRLQILIQSAKKEGRDTSVLEDQLASLLDEVKIQNILDAKYFDADNGWQLKDGVHPIVAKWTTFFESQSGKIAH